MILLQPASGKCKQILGETQSCAACTIEVERTLGLVACFGVFTFFETRPTRLDRTLLSYHAQTAESSWLRHLD